ncbi:hypothetical protein GCM10025869_33750 [Homoserinibacter gongjuensis]|uniref:adenine phosphoribosyltransferase n=1 Tax=Homoserinibacter gongjuensis TaxID=1162968 RepID=A0ABQ6JX09_9MICO|nr:hypothetical protein GCM10025869_33750 [Homoserinibacter gongjuensis]
MTDAAAHLHRLIRTIPDFPEPGIQFRDLTPVLADGEAFATVTDALVAPFAGRYDVVAGVEARGFALAAAAAARSRHGLLLIRKAGKLPGTTLGESYTLEYGQATLELHAEQLPAGTRVLLVDDVLATGAPSRHRNASSNGPDGSSSARPSCSNSRASAGATGSRRARCTRSPGSDEPRAQRWSQVGNNRRAAGGCDPIRPRFGQRMSVARDGLDSWKNDSMPSPRRMPH